MSFDQKAVIALRDQLLTHAQTLGVFDQVTAHEPKNVPSARPSCVIWAQEIRPLPQASGLDASSGYVIWHARCQVAAWSEPLDVAETDLLTVATTLMSEYSGNFTLGGSVRAVDLLGMYGESLSMQAGYLSMGDTFYRIATVVLPMIVNDLYLQGA